jgi:DNA-binding transcriptional regulator YhcF (GntR family)
MVERQLRLTIDGASSVPPFEQARAQIAAQIANGVLVAGTRLPPVRRLAVELGLAANTVARTYRELEAAGLVETRGRGGTVVTSGGDRARQRLVAAARDYTGLARNLGISSDEAIRTVSAAFGEPAS